MVTGLSVREVVVRYGKTVAVDGISLDVPPGQVCALLGPSGSGKSSLLRAVAGLEPLAAGSVSWDDEDLSNVKVHKRNIGVVFQDAQLFTTMNVGKNVAYGLGKLPRAARKQRVAELLDLVGLPGYEARKPNELSGGQAQRVALARSLAPRPRALMLDEPLSALDRGLRERLADDLSRILREAGTTAIYVTHDHAEAFTIADSVAVIDSGQLLQRDDPAALWRKPMSKQVAAFLGFSVFVTEAVAKRLGWSGSLATGQVLGVGPRSLEPSLGGIELPVLDQGYAPDHVEVGVKLPDGQRVTVACPERLTENTLRVRLVSGAITPA